MATDTFIVRCGDKRIVFIRTDTGRIFKISNRRMNENGVTPKAVEVSASYIAELVTRLGVKPSVKVRAARISRLMKEENV